MGGKHILITGGASGLGLGCAERFRELGCHLTIADLNQQAAQAALAALGKHGDAQAWLRAETVDLSDPQSIAALVRRLLARGEPIDVLVNNAGIYPPSNRRETAEGHELSFAIAHLGHFRLSHGLWPLLQQAPAAKLITISSLVQRSARLQLDDLDLRRRYEPILAYQQAKLACLLFAVELQRRLAEVNSPIQSYAAHPGVCRTQLGSNRPLGPQDSAWQRFASAMLRLGQRHIGQSPQTGAEPVVQIASTARFAPGSFVGPRWLFESCGPIGVSPLGAAARDEGLARALWTRSEELTGLRWRFD